MTKEAFYAFVSSLMAAFAAILMSVTRRSQSLSARRRCSSVGMEVML